MNTKIPFLYRDANNYKVHNEIIVQGCFTEEEKQIINDCLIDGEYFIPENVGIEADRFGYFTEDDTDYCELHTCDFEETEKKPTIKMSKSELLKRFLEDMTKCNDMKDFLFQVYINERLCGGVLTVSAKGENEAEQKAMEIVGAKLYEALPELDIEYSVELYEANC